jgi:hypothetical protein
MEKVRLRCSGQCVSFSSLPEEVTEAVSIYFNREQDICTVLAVFAYMFSGMKISDLCDLFILSDKDRIRKASREYVRQKVIGGFTHIRQICLDELGGIAFAAVGRDPLATVPLGTSVYPGELKFSMRQEEPSGQDTQSHQEAL